LYSKKKKKRIEGMEPLPRHAKERGKRAASSVEGGRGGRKQARHFTRAKGKWKKGFENTRRINLS